MVRMVKVFLALALLAMACAPATAQQARKAKIGFLSWFAPALGVHLDYLREGLREFGYVEGNNIEIEAYFTGGNRERTQELTRMLVQKGVDILVVLPTPAIHIAKEATQTIPIVMAPVSDPIATGLVQSLSHPGGNLTGITSFSPDLGGKRVEILREIRPGIRSIAFLGSAKDANTKTFVRETQVAADKIGLKLLVRLVDGPDAIDQAVFDDMKRAGVEAVVVQPIFTGSQNKIGPLAKKSQLPIVSAYPVFAEAGALITYGTTDDGPMRRTAYYVDRILKGAKPADLPIEQPTTYHLVVNVLTAKALGWTIPESLLFRADRVIE